MNFKIKLSTVFLIGFFCGPSFASELETAIISFVNSQMTEMAVIELAASYYSHSGHWPQSEELKAGMKALESSEEKNILVHLKDLKDVTVRSNQDGSIDIAYVMTQKQQPQGSQNPSRKAIDYFNSDNGRPKEKGFSDLIMEEVNKTLSADSQTQIKIVPLSQKDSYIGRISSKKKGSDFHSEGEFEIKIVDDGKMNIKYGGEEKTVDFKNK